MNDMSVLAFKENIVSTISQVFDVYGKAHRYIQDHLIGPVGIYPESHYGTAYRFLEDIYVLFTSFVVVHMYAGLDHWAQA